MRKSVKTKKHQLLEKGLFELQIMLNSKFIKANVVILLIVLLFGCSKDNEIGEIRISSSNYSISYNNVTFEKKIPTAPYGQDYTEVKISYPQFIAESEQLTDINSSLITQLLEDDEFSEISYQSFDQIADSLFSEYKKVQKDFEDYSTPWFIHKNLIVSGLSDNFLSLRNEVAMFTGGANAYFNVKLSTYNLKDGKKILLNDLKNNLDFGEFLEHAEIIFKKEKGLSEEENLAGVGFWFENDEFFLPDNFSITDSGLVFFYNFYQIAPRSEGITELFIPSDKFLKD